jgi:hypothetical protein
VTGGTSESAGGVETVTVTAKDQYGNTATNYAGTVHITSNDGQAVLPPDATLTNGVGTFGVTLKTAGNDSITATDTVASGVSGTESPIVVSPGAASSLVVTGGTSESAGGVETVTVTAKDQYGNTATNYAGTVHITSNDGQAVLPPDATLTNGVGTFHVTLKTAGNDSITATDAGNSDISGTESPIVVSAASLNGTVYLDLNASGTLDAGEPGLAGRVVFLDLNHHGTFDVGDPTATTDANGHFSFNGVVAGSAPVIELTSQDASLRYVVDQSVTNLDGSVAIGAVPFSPVAPVPVVPNPFAANTNPSADAAYVQSLYKAVLGRTGGDTEVATWVADLNGGMTRQQVALGFVNSPEHRQEQVHSYYEEFLHRAPDPHSAFWVDKLLSGAPEELVAEGILDSPEYLSAHPDPTQFVQNLYLDVLGRQGEDAGISAWASRLSSGLSRAAVVAEFVGSPEAVDQIVNSFYASDLHRQSDPTSSAWVQELESPEASATDVAVGFLSDPEFDQDAMNSRV